MTLSLDVSALYGEGQGGTEAPAQLEGGVGVQTQVQQKLQGLKKRGHILISANKQGWGAGAAWKKKSGAGAAKKFAGSSALLEDIKFVL